MEMWYLLITGKFVFWTFWWLEIRSFFVSRRWSKDDIYWLLWISCFELFGDGGYSLFFSQKVDGKMIFTWSFWAFYDIPGLRKYGFSRSGSILKYLNFNSLSPKLSWGQYPFRSSRILTILFALQMVLIISFKRSFVPFII